MAKKNNSFKGDYKKKSPYYESECNIKSDKSSNKDNWKKYGKNILKNYQYENDY